MHGSTRVFVTRLALGFAYVALALLPLSGVPTAGTSMTLAGPEHCC